MTNKTFYQRKEKTNNKDFYPTPPWATRALFEKVFRRISPEFWNKDMTCLEPACGAGHMSRALKRYFHGVDSYDIHDYGYGQVRDFLSIPHSELEWCYDWVITNPPFNHKLPIKFILKAMTFAKKGIAIFGRIQLTEGKYRYEQLFSKNPPIIIAPFVERVTLIKNEITRRRISTQEYAWFVWDNRQDINPHFREPPKIMWIPPGTQKELERNEDYNGLQ